MTVRERILLQLAKNPNYEGQDATEKAIVAELKKEMGSEEPTEPANPEVKEAAKALSGELLKVAELMAEKAMAAKAQPNRETTPANADVPSDDAVKSMKLEVRMAEFVKAMYQKDFVRVRALAEGTDADGGYLVPDQFRAQLIQEVLSGQAYRSLAQVIPMTGKYLELPKLTSDVKVYWGTENKAITTTTADFGNVTLTPFRLNAIIYTSRELFDDSAIAITDILMQRFTARVRDEENRVFMAGSGTGRPKGLSTYTFRAVNAANSLSPDHITKAYWKLPEGYRSTAVWHINSRTMEKMENAKDNQGRYLYDSLQGEVKTLKGRPVFVTDYHPSSKIVFGDPKNYLIGDRQQVTMEMTTEGADTWQKHQVGIKVIERVDGKVGLTSAFVQVSNTGVH